MLVVLVTAGNLRPRTRRVLPTGEKHRTTYATTFTRALPKLESLRLDERLLDNYTANSTTC